MVALCGIISSCEAPFVADKEQTASTHTLTISVFQIEKTPFADFTRTEKEASEVLSRLNYAVFAMDGTRLKQINQTSDQANFGTASFQLEDGNYQIVVVGHSSNGNPTMTDPKAIKFTNAQGYTETFLYNTNVTISGEQVDLPVTLDRIVSLCRFVVTDDFPATVKKMRFYYTGGSGAFDASTGFGCVNSKQEVVFDVIPAQKTFDLYTFLHDMEGTIHLTVSALDASGSEYAQREVEVPMERNSIAWVSGPFFTGSDPSSSNIASVKVRTDWAGETHITY